MTKSGSHNIGVRVFALLILKNLAFSNLKKDIILSLLVNDCILMYLKTTILSIYNFFSTIWMPISSFFFLYTSAPTSLKR